MSTFKKANVVMLTTFKKAPIYCDSTNTLCGENPYLLNTTGKHLYVFNNDLIYEGDYYIRFDINGNVERIFKADLDSTNEWMIPPYSNYCMKIVATTDTSLNVNIGCTNIAPPRTNVPLPSPTQSFIDKFISSYNDGNIIEDVLIEYRDKSPNIKYKDNTVTIRKVKEIFGIDDIANALFETGLSEGVVLKNTTRNDIKKWVKKSLL